MELILQIGFVAATVVTIIGALLLIVEMVRNRRNKNLVHDLHTEVAGRGALLFVGALVATASVTSRLNSSVILGDLVLNAAVFGLASAFLVYWSEDRHAVSRIGRGRSGTALVSLSYLVPLGAGVLAGVVGPA